MERRWLLNQQSIDKFEQSVKPGGLLIFDPNGIVAPPTRTDIDIYRIEGNHLAREMGNKKVFNMIILGGFLKIKPIVKLDSIMEGLKNSIHKRYHGLLPMNEEAIIKGTQSIVPYEVGEELVSQ